MRWIQGLPTLTLALLAFCPAAAAGAGLDPLWSQDLGPMVEGGLMQVARGGHLVVPLAQGGVAVLSARTGAKEVLIRLPGEPVATGVAVDGGGVFFTTRENRLVRADVAGRVDWAVPLTGPAVGSPVLARLDSDAHQDVVVAIGWGLVAGYDGLRGARLWETPLPGFGPRGAAEVGQGISAPVAVSDLDGDGFDDVLVVDTKTRVSLVSGRDGGLGPLPGPKAGATAPWILRSRGITAAIGAGTRLEIFDPSSPEHVRSLPLRPMGDPMILPDGRVLVPEEGGLAVVGGGRVTRVPVQRGVAAMAFGDLLGDQGPQVVLGTAGGRLILLEGGGVAWAADLEPGGALVGLLTVDLDGDRGTDLVVASSRGRLWAFKGRGAVRPGGRLASVGARGGPGARGETVGATGPMGGDTGAPTDDR